MVCLDNLEVSELKRHSPGQTRVLPLLSYSGTRPSRLLLLKSGVVQLSCTSPPFTLNAGPKLSWAEGFRGAASPSSACKSWYDPSYSTHIISSSALQRHERLQMSLSTCHTGMGPMLGMWSNVRECEET